MIDEFESAVLLNLTPCDGYVCQPQSPVIVVVSSRFTADREETIRTTETESYTHHSNNSMTLHSQSVVGLYINM